jgi:peptidoglycan-N-acetylglucosamine deacetylase
MKYKLFAVAILITSASSLLKAQPTTTRRAIICLTYDDGLDSHRSTVLPQLDSVGLKATFFLNSIRGSAQVVSQVSGEVTDWSKAAQNGHELANHTLFHPCPAKLGFARAFSIDKYTVEQIEQEIATQNAILALIDPKRKIRSFAFPCNNVFIGQTDYSRRILEKGLVKFGRAGGDSTSVVYDYKKLNTMQVPSWFVEEGTTLEKLISFAEKVKKNGGLGIYQFHGVGGEFFRISSETHKAFLNYLNENQSTYWVTTFSDAMKHVVAQ